MKSIALLKSKIIEIIVQAIITAKTSRPSVVTKPIRTATLIRLNKTNKNFILIINSLSISQYFLYALRKS